MRASVCEPERRGTRMPVHIEATSMQAEGGCNEGHASSRGLTRWWNFNGAGDETKDMGTGTWTWTWTLYSLRRNYTVEDVTNGIFFSISMDDVRRVTRVFWFFAFISLNFYIVWTILSCRV